MPLNRDAHGVWTVELTSEESETYERWQDDYRQAIPRYLTAFDRVFTKARQVNEFEFLLCLLRVKGLDSAGWDSYPSIKEAFTSAYALHHTAATFQTKRFLETSLYQHILEASHQYELLANLINVAGGGHFQVQSFPLDDDGVELSPGKKIILLKKAAKTAGLSGVVKPFQEVWSPNIRNAIAHANYAWYNGDFRAIKVRRTYPHEKISLLFNRAYACFEALDKLYQLEISSYSKPQMIEIKSDGWPTHATVIVREGYGVVGLKDAWTPEQLASGQIRFRIGVFTPEEKETLERDPSLALLPKRE